MNPEPSAALVAASRVVPTYVRPLIKEDPLKDVKFNPGCFQCDHGNRLGANSYQTIRLAQLKYNAKLGTVTRHILFDAVLCYEDAWWGNNPSPSLIQGVMFRGPEWPRMSDVLVNKKSLTELKGLQTRLYSVGGEKLKHNHDFVPAEKLLQKYKPEVGGELMLFFSGRWGSGVYAELPAEGPIRTIPIEAMRFYNKDVMRKIITNKKGGGGIELIPVQQTKPAPRPAVKKVKFNVTGPEATPMWDAAITQAVNNWATWTATTTAVGGNE